METGTGLSRALVAVLAAKADVVNMSYGEPSGSPDKGRFVELAAELVHRHGVVFVASAGGWAGSQGVLRGPRRGLAGGWAALGASAQACEQAGRSLQGPKRL
jgi:tripeptidyl-peptidase-2